MTEAGPSLDELCQAMGRQVTVRRRELGLSLAQVSAECGVTLQQIHKYETGKSAISAAMVVRLADCLEVPVSYFFPERPDPSLSSQSRGAGVSRRGKCLSPMGVAFRA